MSEEAAIEGAIMETATSPWPKNIDTAQVLVIKQPCMVPDVYQLICDRRNIKKVNVAGHEYSSQEIRCTSFAERLGGGIVEHAPDPVPAPTGRPAPGRTTAFEEWAQQAPGQWALNITEAQREILNGPPQTAPARGTIGIYEQYIQNRPPMPTRGLTATQQRYEDLIQDPAYARNAELYREAMITEDPIWGLQANAGGHGAISPADSYF